MSFSLKYSYDSNLSAGVQFSGRICASHMQHPRFHPNATIYRLRSFICTLHVALEMVTMYLHTIIASAALCWNFLIHHSPALCHTQTPSHHGFETFASTVWIGGHKYSGWKEKKIPEMNYNFKHCEPRVRWKLALNFNREMSALRSPGLTALMYYEYNSRLFAIDS